MLDSINVWKWRTAHFLFWEVSQSGNRTRVLVWISQRFHPPTNVVAREIMEGAIMAPWNSFKREVSLLKSGRLQLWWYNWSCLFGKECRSVNLVYVYALPLQCPVLSLYSLMFFENSSFDMSWYAKQAASAWHNCWQLSACCLEPASDAECTLSDKWSCRANYTPINTCTSSDAF